MKRADALAIRAQLLAAEGQYANAASTAQSALAVIEQLPFGGCNDSACQEREQALLKTLANAQIADQQWGGAEQSLRRALWPGRWDSPARLWAIEALANSLQQQGKSDRDVWLNVFEDAQQRFQESVEGENVDAPLRAELRAARELATRSIAALNPDVALIWWNRVRTHRLQLLGADHVRTQAATLENEVLAQLLKFEGISIHFAMRDLKLLPDDAIRTTLGEHVVELEHDLLTDAIAEFTNLPTKTSATVSPQQYATRAAWRAEFRLSPVMAKKRSQKQFSCTHKPAICS